MRYEIRNTRELIIGVRANNLVNTKLFDDFLSVLSEYKGLSCFLCMEEHTNEDEKKDNHHYHIGIVWDNIPKPTTFRSFIQKHLGKSNIRFDWKYRIVKQSSFWSYITKGGNIKKSYNFDMEYYKTIEKWKDEPDPKVIRKNIFQEIKKNLKEHCAECTQYEEVHYCRKCCIRAVVKYYDDNEKVYDRYRMRNLAQSIYFRDELRQEEFINMLDWET